MDKPTGNWKCRACKTVWGGYQLYQDPSSTAVKWTCADLACGGTCDKQEESAKIKISFRSYEEAGYQPRRRKAKPNREGFCRACGSPLKTEKSKKAGIGHVCAKKQNAIIVLDIQSLKEE